MAASVGKAVRSRRNVIGMTRNDLASRTGLSVSYVGLVESGTRCPTLLTLFRIANVLDCNVTDLVYPLDTRRSA